MWLVRLALWLIVMLVRLLALPFVLVYLAVAFIIEALFRILLWRTGNLDGTEPPG